ncbi:MAG: threonine--tRNA ligase [Deltaproteobacteria bacterium]|nr:threonine--tRNA ligase [Deltaproteobacteria bacterium]
MSSEVKVSLPDGSQKQVAAGTPVSEFIREQIGEGLLRAALGASLDGVEVDLGAPIEKDSALKIFTSRDEEGLMRLRHSAAHILASAVQRLFPGAVFDDGPATEMGFFYDIGGVDPFTPEDLERIEEECKKLLKEGAPFVKRSCGREEALKWVEETGQRYKAAIIERLPEDAEISFYKHGEFEDMCRGPHLSDTGKIKAFKVLSVAGAYQGGQEGNEQLQRIYGTAFTDKKELKAHLERLEEAKKRDHRKLGKELDLFSVDEKVGGGLILWHPNGALIRKQIEDLWRDEHLAAGYDLVYSPHVGRATLWETSGHLDFYKEGMYPEMELEGQSFYAKPMNCPFHMMIYKHGHRSYRELPLKFAELGTVYRYERSGTLHGLMRVRGFTQDDAHLFVAPENLEEQVVDVVNFCLQILRTFGFSEFEAYVSTMPEKAVGEPEEWDRATKALEKAATAAGLDYKIDEGGGAFYGPKIDLKLKDAIGRTWQCSTVQFDFNLPERFDLEFVGSDNAAHRPYVIHRALLGSIERFVGVLTEHHAGAFPFWLSPVQVGIVTIADRHLEAALALAADLKAAGIRVKVDEASDKMNAKIRRFSLQKVPAVLVLGDKEVEEGGASLRLRGGADEGFLAREALVERLAAAARRPKLGESAPELP